MYRLLLLWLWVPKALGMKRLGAPFMVALVPCLLPPRT